MRIIPAIDIINGKCVRLSKGNFASQKTYNHNPVEVAKAFEDHGVQFLHLVDLDGAKAGRIVNYKILEHIASQTKLQIDFGGGVKNTEAVTIAFNHGASKITGGSIAVTNPSLFVEWLQLFGADKIILGADASNRKIATNAWLQIANIDIVDFIVDFQKQGVQFVVATDIDKDGMLGGASIDLYKELLSKTNIKLIASGGVASLSDLSLLQSIGCEGAIVGKAFYEGYITLKDLKSLC